MLDPTPIRCYRIVRFYQRGTSRTIRTGLTEAEAQAWCNDPETSSTTCTRAAGKRRTAARGPWFDGYDFMRGIRAGEGR